MQSLYNVIEDFSDESFMNDFLRDVYGSEQEIPYKKWCSRIIEKCDYIFDPRKLRAKVLEYAHIELKHTKV